MVVTRSNRPQVADVLCTSIVSAQVSFREHLLVPEPFVLVALIAAVRRILMTGWHCERVTRKPSRSGSEGA